MTAAKAKAKVLVQQANIDYKVGRFEIALAGYSQAYELFHAPELLFDIGQCQKNLSHYSRAIYFFQEYLSERPTTPNRVRVEKMIAESQAQQAKLDEQARLAAAAIAAAREAEAKQAELERLRLQAEAASQAASQGYPGLEADRADARSQSVTRKVWFWGAVGGGVIVVAAVAATVAVLLSRPAKFGSPSLGTVNF